MELYTIKDIAEACGVSKQAVYKLIEKNSKRIDTVTVKRGRKVFYSQSVYAFCVNHYMQSAGGSTGAEMDAARAIIQPVSSTVNTNGKPNRAERLMPEGAERGTDAAGTGAERLTVDALTKQVEQLTAERDGLTLAVEKLRKKNKRLRARISSLETEIEKTEAERVELLKQCGMALLALSQEKQEKQLLLPEARKTFGEKIKGLFGKG